MKRSRTQVAILGAGLTGMSAAHFLKKAQVPFRIFEKQERAGGHAITLADSGFRFDRTGHLLHLRDPEMRALSLGWMGGDVLEIQRQSRIFSHGTYTRYPYQANTFGLPPEIAYECLMGFLAARARTDWPAAANFEEFCLQHFGEGFSKHFMIPYNCRLWGVHPREITAEWCQRFVPLPKLEDVIAGAVGANNRELGYNSHFLYPRMGIEELPKGMARELPMIEYGRCPSSVDEARRELVFDDEIVTYDVLVSTAPLDALGRLLGSVPPEVRGAFSSLRCQPLQYLDVGISVPFEMDLHWVYVPEESYPFYRIGCYSNFSPAMAPAGKACFYVELSDRRPPDLGALVPEIAKHLVEMRFIRSERDIELVRSRTIDHAYVIYDHAYVGALDRITPYLVQNRILSAGRYGGWNYSSMEDALLFGRDAAKRAEELLGSGNLD